MSSLNITVEIPDNGESYDVNAIKALLSDYASRLLKSSFCKKKKEDSVDPFADLDFNWGGDRDSHEIADELHELRQNTRTIDSWQG